MRLDISGITKLNGRSIDVEFNVDSETLNNLLTDYKFEDINLKGRLTNNNSVLELKGLIYAKYKTGCYRCLKGLTRELTVRFRENFTRKGSQTHDEDDYTYEGDYIDMEQVLVDNIVLHLPTKVLCSENCKGLCQRCGCDLNISSCQCEKYDINPQMEALKKFFEK